MELLLVVGCALLVCVVVFVAMRFAAAGLRRLAAYFVLAARPPSLTHLTAVVAAWREERQAAEAARLRREPPPLPEIVLAFRDFTQSARGLSAEQATGLADPGS
jgi:hypothetical protein